MAPYLFRCIDDVGVRSSPESSGDCSGGTCNRFGSCFMSDWSALGEFSGLTLLKLKTRAPCSTPFFLCVWTTVTYRKNSILISMLISLALFLYKGYGISKLSEINKFPCKPINGATGVDRRSQLRNVWICCSLDIGKF